MCLSGQLLEQRAIAGSSLQKDLGISAVTLGYIFSAFGWAYVAGQIPGGWLLDRFGSKKVYALSIFTWSLFTILQGYVGEFGVSTASRRGFARPRRPNRMRRRYNRG